MGRTVVLESSQPAAQALRQGLLSHHCLIRQEVGCRCLVKEVLTRVFPETCSHLCALTRRSFLGPHVRVQTTLATRRTF